METFVVKLDDVEVARLTGEGITCAKKLTGTFPNEIYADDPKMLKINRDGHSVIVLLVSARQNVTVERLP